MSTHSPQALLISDRTRPGSSDLEKRLREILSVRLVSPVYVTPTELDDPLMVDKAAFRARHLRLPTPGEVGCALAHRAAQEQIVAGPSKWGLVFEDDAIVKDPGHFKTRFDVYEKILDVEEPVVVNVNVHAIPQPQSRSRVTSSGLMSLHTPPYPATAYAINRSAAALFFQHQNPIRSQADWPTSTRNVRFYVDTQSRVWESTDLTSRIDESGVREQIPSFRKLLMWSGVWYWRERKHFSSFSDFWYSLPRQRLGFHAYTLSVWWRDKTKRRKTPPGHLDNSHQKF